MVVGKKENSPIRMQAGSVQISMVMTASNTPPRLYPISVRVCVEDAPGSSCQKALYSSNSSSVTSFRFWTNVFSIMA